MERTAGPTHRASASQSEPSGGVRPGAVAAPPAPERRAELLLAERERLQRFVTSLARHDPHQVEDIVQETLLRAWQLADRLDWSDLPIRMWLFRVARHLLIDGRRKDRAVPVGIAAEGFPDQAPVADQTAQVLDRQVLVDSLRSLDPIHREAVVHVHLLGRAGPDAARLLGIPGGTLKSRTHYGVQALRRNLADRGVVAHGIAS
ncbi:sigma-70 family RNA polymerase sigma factor [Kitasatospora sp. NBC_00240]|uniref:sigma-70 family RNA polymerase sigma factor n=1 Tax=Kitasatospora sp. NBC_00240 TaxID=2903567 RepID=UPI00225BA2C6|nr:sigma-70 family RNA polymerase sigma factor [Kitasatospora sp. NBC_00240]MCX5214959.1 sigma-70 family RNA polymerase sigma factor [Kitasatospora sp. NBC_00240]